MTVYMLRLLWMLFIPKQDPRQDANDTLCPRWQHLHPVPTLSLPDEYQLQHSPGKTCYFRWRDLPEQWNVGAVYFRLDCEALV